MLLRIGSNVFPASFDCIGDLLKGLEQDSSSRKLNYIRGYINGLEDYSLGENLLRFSKSENHAEKLISEAFSGSNPKFGKKSGVVINGGLQWSAALRSKAVNCSKEITDPINEKQFTIDLTFFIGAYGATPFGVHVDDPTHSTILFNLGPEEKGISLWNNDNIYAQFGAASNINKIAEIESASSDYTFSKGSCFILPSSQFHVGWNRGLSSVAALVINHLTEQEMVKSEISQLLDFQELSGQKIIDKVKETSISFLVNLNRSRLESNDFLRYPLKVYQSDPSLISLDTRLSTGNSKNLNIVQLSEGSLIYSNGFHYY